MAPGMPAGLVAEHAVKTYILTMLVTPSDWVRRFVGMGKTRDEIRRAGERMGWDHAVIDRAIEQAIGQDDIEQAFAEGFMRSITKSKARRSPFYRKRILRLKNG